VIRVSYEAREGRRAKRSIVSLFGKIVFCQPTFDVDTIQSYRGGGALHPAAVVSRSSIIENSRGPAAANLGLHLKCVLLL
jgi:hypothetical protein